MPRERAAQRIGMVADATGLTPDAIRYYERLGLLPKAARTEGGCRVYPPGTIARLRFVKQAQTLGLTLKEIRELLGPVDGRRREQCERVRSVLARHLADVHARIHDLETFRETLQSALEQCDRALRRKEIIDCPVVSRLGSEQA